MTQRMDGKTGEELDRAADMARNIADRVVLSLRARGYKVEDGTVKTVMLKETIQGVAQDVLVYG